jgi:hypothetical protein
MNLAVPPACMGLSSEITEESRNTECDLDAM